MLVSGQYIKSENGLIFSLRIMQRGIIEHDVLNCFFIGNHSVYKADYTAVEFSHEKMAGKYSKAGG